MDAFAWLHVSTPVAVARATRHSSPGPLRPCRVATIDRLDLVLRPMPVLGALHEPSPGITLALKGIRSPADAIRRNALGASAEMLLEPPADVGPGRLREGQHAHVRGSLAGEQLRKCARASRRPPGANEATHSVLPSGTQEGLQQADSVSQAKPSFVVTKHGHSRNEARKGHEIDHARRVNRCVRPLVAEITREGEKLGQAAFDDPQRRHPVDSTSFFLRCRSRVRPLRSGRCSPPRWKPEHQLQRVGRERSTSA